MMAAKGGVVGIVELKATAGAIAVDGIDDEHRVAHNGRGCLREVLEPRVAQERLEQRLLCGGPIGGNRLHGCPLCRVFAVVDA